MGGGRWGGGAGFGLALAVAGILSGCASGGSSRAPLSDAPEPVAGPDHYVDARMGFEISRPGGNWLFASGHEAPEGIAVPLVVLHEETGAQVVVQVAPQVAAPTEFAERLASGLRTKPGFTTSLPVTEKSGRSSFAFALGDVVFGKVSVTDGRSGQTFVLLATWPADAPEDVVRDVDSILESLRPIEIA